MFFAEFCTSVLQSYEFFFELQNFLYLCGVILIEKYVKIEKK